MEVIPNPDWTLLIFSLPSITTIFHALFISPVLAEMIEAGKRIKWKDDFIFPDSS